MWNSCENAYLLVELCSLCLERLQLLLLGLDGLFGRLSLLRMPRLLLRAVLQRATSMYHAHLLGCLE